MTHNDFLPLRDRKRIGDLAVEQAAQLASGNGHVVLDLAGSSAAETPIAATARVAILVAPPNQPEQLAAKLSAWRNRGVKTIVFAPQFTNSADWREALSLSTACILSSRHLAEVTGEPDTVMGLHALSMLGVAAPLLVVNDVDSGVVTALHRGEWLVERPRIPWLERQEGGLEVPGAFLGTLAAAIAASSDGELLLPAARRASVAMSMTAAGSTPSNLDEIDQFDASNPWQHHLNEDLFSTRTTRWGAATAVGLLLGAVVALALDFGIQGA